MRNKYLIAALIFAISIASCKKDNSVGPQAVRDDAAFSRYENNFFEGLWKLEPDYATLQGYHKFDSLLTVPDDKNREKLLYYAKLQVDSLSSFQTSSLSESNKLDYQLIDNQMEYLEWRLQELRSFEWNPTVYNLNNSFASILNTPYAPLAKRLRNFYQRMGVLPDYYKQAEKSIHNPVKELTALAIAQIQSGLNVFGKNFADSLKKSGIPQPEQKQILDRATASVGIIKGFTTWLQNLKNDQPRSFRLGKELYDAKFKYEIQSDVTPQQLYDAAVEEKKRLHLEMAKLSRQLWPKYFGNAPIPADTLNMIARVIDTLSANHAKGKNIKAIIENNISKLSAFIKTKNLVTFNPVQRLIVHQQPDNQGNTATISFCPPVPYESNANCYFNFPDMKQWPTEEADSYLREYNNYTMQLVCMHEAVPGRYLQYTFAGKSPDMVKLVFATPATSGGWGDFATKMALDSGYNNTPEMKLMWYKSRLSSACNTILDYGVHEQNMSRQDALNLLTREAFQQQTEAEHNWTRVTETSVELDYDFAGYRALNNLHDNYKKQAGQKYTLKAFNDKFLSYGNIPVSYIQNAMMTAPKKNPDSTGQQ